MLRLSVIVPIYNVEKYIGQCLESLYRQDLEESEYEVICVDDCSPDHSMDIVRHFSLIHSNIKIVTNAQNRKLGGARNAGMEVATGKYVLFVDSDDFIAANSLNYLCTTAEKEKLDVLHFDHEAFPDCVVSRKVEDTQVMTGPDMFFDNRYIWYLDLVTAWCKIYRREFLIDNGIVFAEHIMYEDNDYAIKVFANATRVKHVRFDAYYYRSNPESITRSALSSTNISYWMDLCHRLLRLKKQFVVEGKDQRFQWVLESFIRYEVCNVIDSVKNVPVDDRNNAKRIVQQGIDSSLKKFMSRKRYFLLKFGVIK